LAEGIGCLMLPAQGARGWVVDLRVNIGGTMWPMIAGAGR
jgi:C-terminal processing protease CtpA/Prc